MLDPLQDFLERGGPVLTGILLVSTLMWFSILERGWYYRFGHPRRLAEALRQWRELPPLPTRARQLRRRVLLAQLDNALDARLATVRTCTHILPLLGLLGTVTGMIAIFDVVGAFGTGNPRGMAAGISRALLPTTTGLVTALVGIACRAALQRRAAGHQQQARRLLAQDGQR